MGRHSQYASFPSNVVQILTTFPENLQKEMQINGCSHPLPLSEYKELVHQDKQGINAPVLCH